jgi:lipoprotein-anchoring transpeptidase ErfK/SrfK
MRRSRVLALAVSTAVVVVAVVLASGGDSGGGHSSTARPTATPPPAQARAPKPPSAAAVYASVRARGAPVAVLTRRVAVRAAPRFKARKLAALGLRTEWHSPRVLAVVGRRGSWLRVLATELPDGRSGWSPFAAARLVPDPWSLRADLSARTVSVFRRGRLVRRFPVAVGRTATPTPTGRFGVTDKINMKRHGVYGCCALALTGHQPNISPGWSGGDRLAIHATQLGYTIGTPASHGCLRARDEDARFLIHHVWLGSIVTIRR